MRYVRSGLGLYMTSRTHARIDSADSIGAMLGSIRAGVPMIAAYDIEEASRGAVSSADAGAVALTPCPCDTGAGIMVRVGCQDGGGAGRRSRHVHTTCHARGNTKRDEACSASARETCGLVGGSADPTSFAYATLVWCCIAMSAVQRSCVCS